MTGPEQPGNAHKGSLDEIIEKHEKLKRAYIEVETKCNNVVAELQKAHKIRILATLFIITVFVIVGLYTWKKVPYIERRVEKSLHMGKKTSAARTFRVDPGPISESISQAGELKPGEVVNIVAPFEGIVKDKHFQYGEYVKKGQPLLELDISDIEIKYNGAKTDYINAADKLQDFQNWENSDDVMKAKRSLSRSKMTLEAQKKAFQATEGLFKEGIVSETEYENAKQQYSSAQLDYENAIDELKSTRAKGTGDHLKVADVEMQTAKSKFKELERQLNQARVTAPVTGVIVLPSSEDKEKKGKMVDRGVSFSRGEILVTIGNIERLSVQVDIDEMEVLKIKNGQDVMVTGDAFPGTALKGKVSSISSQVIRDDAQKGPPSFRVTITIDGLPQSVMEKIRLGMSADVKILTYSKTDALTVPFQAVKHEGNDYFVIVKGKAPGQLNKIKVEAGITTLDRVEILKGVRAGDEIVIDHPE